MEKLGFNSTETSIYLDPMLKTVEFPAIVTDLNPGLTNVDRNALSHFRDFASLGERKKKNRRREKDKGAF